MSIEDFVANKAEREGYFNMFEIRNRIWIFVKENRIKILCDQMKALYKTLTGKWIKKKDGLVRMQIEWSKWLSSLNDNPTNDFMSDETSDDKDMHLRCILRTMGKYVIMYVKENGEIIETKKKISKKIIKRAIQKQPVYGIQVLAGGTLGAMFRLFRKNIAKYSNHYKIIKEMTIQDKTSATKKDIPVQQRIRDKGGLYVIRPDYLPALKEMDNDIAMEFHNADKHGRNIIRVSISEISYHFLRS